MKRWRTSQWVAGIALLGLLLALTAIGLTEELRTRTVQIDYGNLTFHWDTNVMEFAGSSGQPCKLTMTAPHQATMTAPKMSCKLSSGGQDIEWLETGGTTYLTVLTSPDEEGAQLKIIATGSHGGKYSKVSQTVELTGAAKADLISVPEGTGEAHFTAETLQVNLKTKTITATKGHLKVITPLEDEQPEAGE